MPWCNPLNFIQSIFLRKNKEWQYKIDSVIMVINPYGIRRSMSTFECRLLVFGLSTWNQSTQSCRRSRRNDGTQSTLSVVYIIQSSGFFLVSCCWLVQTVNNHYVYTFCRVYIGNDRAHQCIWYDKDCDVSFLIKNLTDWWCIYLPKASSDL